MSGWDDWNSGGGAAATSTETANNWDAGPAASNGWGGGSTQTPTHHKSATNDNDHIEPGSFGGDMGNSDNGDDNLANGGAGDYGMEGGGGNDKCFGCGEVGHRRAECPNPQEMTCRYCKQPGHMLRECPDKPPMACNNCGEEGHMRKDCTNARKIDREHVAEVSMDVAWDKIKRAAAEKDSDDAKEGIQEYVKALNGEATFREIQQGLMNDGIPLWMIGLERPILGTFTCMDLQGNTEKKYAVSYRFSDKPARPREAQEWPQSVEEILERLDNAGDIVSNGLRRCNNCGECGHISKNCEEEKVDKSEIQPKISCHNCGEDGHRSRDCTEPRKSRTACRKCGEEGHQSRECPNAQEGGGGACFNCGEEGHRKSECPNEAVARSVTCFNCGEEGHRKGDCPNPPVPRAISCYNCGENHRQSDCPTA